MSSPLNTPSGDFKHILYLYCVECSQENEYV